MQNSDKNREFEYNNYRTKSNNFKNPKHTKKYTLSWYFA